MGLVAAACSIMFIPRNRGTSSIAIQEQPLASGIEPHNGLLRLQVLELHSCIFIRCSVERVRLATLLNAH